MRSVRFGGIAAALAMSTLSLMATAEPVGPPAPKRRASRHVTAAPPYRAKLPTSELDYARLDAAERKRARKAAKLKKDFGR